MAEDFLQDQFRMSDSPGGGGANLPRGWVSWPWPVVCAIAGAILGLVVYIDIITGIEIRVEFFYIIPALLVTWFVGQRAGYIMGAVSVIVWLVAELHGATIYSRPVFAYANAATRLGFFLMAVTLLSAFKNLSTRLGVLVDQRTRSLRQLASQLSEAEDAERRRLAYDIHDGFSQNLSVLKMSLAATLPEASEGPSSRKRIGDALALVDDLIDRSRTLTFDLHPAMLDHLGLVPTLRRYAEQFSLRANVEVIVSDDGPARRLPSPIANYLFRSTKELFNNAAKHGRARQIVAVIHWGDRQIRIVIDDDGSGFDAADVFSPGAAKGLGLVGMRERLMSLGGSIRLESSAGEGTRVVIELPLSDQEIVK